MAKKCIESEVVIDDIVFPNKGVGFFNGKKVYVKNTIPGQKVKVKIKGNKQKYEAKLLDIIEKADYEIEPNCNVFGVCGGCTYQNISYEKELEIKKNNILKILEEGGIRDFEFLGINRSPMINEYRNKMEFSFGDTCLEGELSLGMRKRNSYYEVVNAGDCKIVSEDIRKILNFVLNYFKNTDEKFYHRMKKTGSLRHLLIRQANFTGEILVNIVTTSNLNISLENLKYGLLNIDLDGKIVGILHILNDSVADVIKSDNLHILYGNDYFYEELLGLKFKISVFSFFQTNSAGAEVLYSIIRKFSEESDNGIILDLYCGTGTIAQILSKNAKKVIGVELVEDSILFAKENAKLNNITNCEFIAGDVYKVVQELKEKPDLIILDPPREGINPKAIEKIVGFGSKRLIYISCKASSMIGNLKDFINNGYIINKIELIDMFPRTYHVETVILLSRKAPDAEIKVRLDMSELDITSAESKATYKEIQEYVKNKYDLHVTNLYIAQVKREFGIIERENYNTGEGKAKVPQVTPEKREAIIDALKYFQMIE